MANSSVITMVNDNNQYITIGPIKDSNTGVAVDDLQVTISLFKGRNVANPVDTPGDLVDVFGNHGSLNVPHTANGMYQTVIPAFTVSPGIYVLVMDAPASPTGYQFHRERTTSIATG